MRFVVSKNFFNKIPDAYFGIIIVKNFDNEKDYPEFRKFLEESINAAYVKYKDINIKENILIKKYRDAFLALNINPNKYKCSIEALISRIAKGNIVPSINPIVDLCNALSIKYVAPIGVHDIDKFDSDIEIREAHRGDEFIPFGSNEIEYPEEGEIIYVSGNDVKTRKWTWRQGENSKITNKAKNFFIPIDGFLSNKEQIDKLQNELLDVFNKLGLETKIGYVDKENNSFEF